MTGWIVRLWRRFRVVGSVPKPGKEEWHEGELTSLEVLNQLHAPESAKDEVRERLANSGTFSSWRVVRALVGMHTVRRHGFGGAWSLFRGHAGG